MIVIFPSHASNIDSVSHNKKFDFQRMTNQEYEEIRKNSIYIAYIPDFDLNHLFAFRKLVP